VQTKHEKKLQNQTEDKVQNKNHKRTKAFYLPCGGIAPKEGKAVLKPIVNFVESQLSIFGFVDCLKIKRECHESLSQNRFHRIPNMG